MRILFGTKFVLDLLLDRQPFSSAALQLFSAVEHGALFGRLGATTITTVHDLVAKGRGPQPARSAIESLLGRCSRSHR